MLHSIYLQELEPLVKTITAKTSSSSKVFEYHSDQLQWPSSSRWWWIALCMYIVNSSVVILTTHMYDSDHQHHHHSRITFCYRMEKNPGHGIHRSNGALLSKISGKLQPSPPPPSFWLFLVSSPQAAASLFMHPLEFSSLIYYMQCSAFEKLGNKKPPCFPPLSPLNFFIWKVRKRFLFVCWRDARGRGTRLTGHLQHFSNTWDAAAGFE